MCLSFDLGIDPRDSQIGVSFKIKLPVKVRDMCLAFGVRFVLNIFGLR